MTEEKNQEKQSDIEMNHQDKFHVYSNAAIRGNTIEKTNNQMKILPINV